MSDISFFRVAAKVARVVFFKLHYPRDPSRVTSEARTNKHRQAHEAKARAKRAWRHELAPSPASLTTRPLDYNTLYTRALPHLIQLGMRVICRKGDGRVRVRERREGSHKGGANGRFNKSIAHLRREACAVERMALVFAAARHRRDCARRRPQAQSVSAERAGPLWGENKRNAAVVRARLRCGCNRRALVYGSGCLSSASFASALLTTSSIIFGSVSFFCASNCARSSKPFSINISRHTVQFWRFLRACR